MSDIQVFTYQSNDVRTVELDGKPWFVLKDVCEVLNISNRKDVQDRLDADEVGRFDLPHPQSREKTIEVVCVSESGLYNVILRSDKPEAKPFRKWVTSEVLPSIRKTGGYMMQGMSKELQSIFLLDQRTMKHEERISALENTMTVDSGKQQVLQQTVNNIVVKALGGKESPAYNDHHVRSKTYAELHRDLKSWFKVPSYRDVPKKRFDEAVEYIQRWKPSTNTVMLIQQTNNQTSLFGDEQKV